MNHRESKGIPEETSASITVLKPLTVWMDHNKLWKILKEMGVPDHFTCLLRNLCAGQEAAVRTLYETDWFKVGKGIHQGCILSPCLFHFCAEYIMWNVELDESQVGIKITGRNVNNLRYADDTIPIVESDRPLIILSVKSLLITVKEKSEKSWLKIPP